jgi:hypothetical protein
MERTMSSRPLDTDPDAFDVQFALLRRASLSRRVQLAIGLSDTVRHLARQAILHADPAATAEEVGLRFVEAHYGRELADAVRQELTARLR